MSRVPCSNCGKIIVKKNPNQRFCCNKCKDQWWNSQPDRLQRSSHRKYPEDEFTYEPYALEEWDYFNQ